MHKHKKRKIKHEPSYKQREVNMNRTSHLCANRDKLTTYIYIKIIIIYRRCGGIVSDFQHQNRDLVAF